MPTTSRVAAIRHWLYMEGYDAIIIPSSDPHNSEYTPDRWKIREWATGFTGSAGTAVITRYDGALWTDSRYFIQAEQQLQNSPFELMREGVEGVPSMLEWLNQKLNAKDKVAFIGEMVSIKVFEEWLENSNLEFISVEDPFDYLWTDRPQDACNPMRIHLIDRAGEGVASKLQRIRDKFEKKDTTYLMLSDLSEIAWALNLRGSDVPYNPLFLSYLIIFDEGAMLFVNKRKLTAEVSEYLAENGIKVRDYQYFRTFIAAHYDRGQYYVITSSTNYDVIQYIERLGVDYDIFDSPVEDMRMYKNPTEQEGFRKAMRSDGVVLVKTLRWLSENVGSGNITEVNVAEKIKALREQMPDFRGESFETIAGYAANGAIVHYEATPADCATLKPEGLLLLDTGAHYQSGTTDVSRTIPLGPLGTEECKAYTLVLKGHIALARCRFPEGTVGLELDLAARYAMWQEGYDFGHGTGHGVGARLCVHEGPHQIRKNVRPCTLVPFKADMTVTNEPGIYVENQFGVRIENVLLCKEHRTTPYGKFLEFETLTLCPIATEPIIKEMMTTDEIQWLNNYNAWVQTTLDTLLDDAADRAWLTQATKPI
ncbi:MAG: aminopeptidase P family protein [Bacteroidaceae bacterium]|nr:aminopeptidase P family protein [Bacteroidaceae bacterium]